MRAKPFIITSSCFAEDRTECYGALAALRESEAIFESLAEQSPNLIHYAGERSVLGTITDITACKAQRRKLEAQAKTIAELDIALKVLLERQGKEKAEVKANLLADLKQLVFPYLEKLETKGLGKDAKTFVDVIKSNINDLTSPLLKNVSSKYFALTRSEIQIADLIKQGKTSKEIASMLHVSPQAVAFHRGNLRRKLGISNKKINLRTYLQSFPS